MGLEPHKWARARHTACGHRDRDRDRQGQRQAGAGMDPEQQRVPMVQSAVVNAAPPYFPQNFEAPHGGKQQGGAAPPPMGAPDPWFVAGPQQPPVVVATVVAQPGYGMADSWP